MTASHFARVLSDLWVWWSCWHGAGCLRGTLVPAAWRVGTGAVVFPGLRPALGATFVTVFLHLRSHTLLLESCIAWAEGVL